MVLEIDLLSFLELNEYGLSFSLLDVVSISRISEGKAVLSDLKPSARGKHSMRYSGIFRMETNGFGFIMDPKGADGSPVPNLPVIEGKPGGIFLSAAVAAQTLGHEKHLMKSLDGSRVSFYIRQCEAPHGKPEAWSVSEASGRFAL